MSPAHKGLEAATRRVLVLFALLGHSTIKATTDVYGRLMQEGDNDATQMAILTLGLEDANLATLSVFFVMPQAHF
jgi:hypothetical protein